MLTKRKKGSFAVLLALTAVTLALGQDFDLSRHTIDSGGGMLSTGGDFELSDTISDYWVNFAANADPNAEGAPEWEAYNREDEPYMDLGDTVKTGRHLNEKQLDFLEKHPARRLGVR